MKCKEECCQMVIPVFYGLDPSHVRKQTGDFGKIFEKTCHNRTEELKFRWRVALTNVANILGYHSVTWGNEAKMIEAIANDVLGKLLLTPSKDFENFVGIEDHIAQMSVLLYLESEEVRMVGIWGPSGIGKTTIARALFNRISRHFQGSVFIDRRFISKIMKIYNKGNPDDYNMKLHLQESFLSKILDKHGIKVDHLEMVHAKLKDMKVLIFIDDLTDQVVLDTLVGGDEWFGPGSRIIVITKDKHILRSHGIKCIYEVSIPPEKVALQMFCQSAFRKKYPPDGFKELASEVAARAGGLPLGLNLLGSSMRGRTKKYWVDMLPILRNGLDEKIEKALRVSYDGLERKEYKTLFRHIACFFTGAQVDNIKSMLADSELNVDMGLKTLVDKSLIHILPSLNIVEMNCLVEEMGREIVRAQSDEFGEREFLIDSKNVCDVLEENTGTKNVLGISLNVDEIKKLHIHKEAFKRMHNLHFLDIYTKKWDQKKEVTWHLREGFDYFPPKLRLLRLDGYPMKGMPSNFRPENLIKLQMRRTKLERLWEGVHSLTGLKNMDFQRSKKLKEIPDLSLATNLEILRLNNCSRLVELPSSIQHLNKLKKLDMPFCENLETLPSGINLQSLHWLDLRGCSRLRSFPDISTNLAWLCLSQTGIEEFSSNLRLENLIDLTMYKMKSEKLWQRPQSIQPLTLIMTMLASHSLKRMWLSNIQSLVELPSSFRNLNNLTRLSLTECTNLETLPTGMNLESLKLLNLNGCSRLRTFPNISTNILEFYLEGTAIEEVPWWIENFTKLRLISMRKCNSLKYVSLNVSKLKHLETVDFSDCGALSEARWNDDPNPVAITIVTIHSMSPILDEAYSSLPYTYLPKVGLNFINCFNLDQEALLQQQSVFFKSMQLSGKEVPSYFTHMTTGTSSLAIHLLQTSLSQTRFKFKVCAVVDSESFPMGYHSFNIQVSCRFIDTLGNNFDFADQPLYFSTASLGSHLFIFDCCFLLNEENSPLPRPSYDHVEIQFHLTDDCSHFKLKGCGIRLHEDDPFMDNRACNPNILPRVYEGNKINCVNFGGHETEHCEECGDKDVEGKRTGKRRPMMMLGRLRKKLLTCFAANPQNT